jgi:predicted CopG family antitoxin
MTLKTIKIKEFIYTKLLERKKDDESISDVIERLLGFTEQSKNIKKYFGLWKDVPKEYFMIMESDFKETHEEINRRLSNL